MTGIDLSRLPPKVYIRNHSASKEIRREVYGYLTSTSTTSDPSVIIDPHSPTYKNIASYPTTLVFRAKQTNRIGEIRDVPSGMPDVWCAS